MWSYFDLNVRALKSRNKAAKAYSIKLEEIERRVSGKVKPPVPERNEFFLSPIRQILMYFGIFIGVLFSTAISQFESGAIFNITTITVGTVVASGIIALIITPYVYEKLSLNSPSPFIVQFGFFVQNGVFWHVIIKSIAMIV